MYAFGSFGNGSRGQLCRPGMSCGVAQCFDDPDEVALRVDPVHFAVVDQGVDQGGILPGVGASHE